MKARLSLDEVREYWDAFEESPLLMGEVLPLMPLAAEIATCSGCIIYDALFVALAESEDTVMVTAEAKLLRALEGTPYATRGVHLKNATNALPRFEDLRFLAFDNRLNDAARSVDLAVYGDDSRAEGEKYG